MGKYGRKIHKLKCKIKNCNNLIKIKGYCFRHFKDWLKEIHRCKIKDCNQKFRAKGYCDKHYKRWKKWGNPLTVRSPIGSKNVNWKRGISEYPNHYLMKKNRLIILKRCPRCEICEKPAIEIHHRNGNKSESFI